MENEKNLNEMSIDELIDVILKNPEKMYNYQVWKNLRREIFNG